MIIVDTTVWIDYLRDRDSPETNYLDREFGRQPFALTDLILCETLQGMPDEPSFTWVLNEFRKFEIFDTGGKELADSGRKEFPYAPSAGTHCAQDD